MKKDHGIRKKGRDSLLLNFGAVWGERERLLMLIFEHGISLNHLSIRNISITNSYLLSIIGDYDWTSVIHPLL